ncbi:MAG TPA: hypothetical protein VJO33_05205 [Gemmatimonadaceae bacterium]|nr:hypothetical protein [Gemmatimonadaceae bacterium]
MPTEPKGNPPRDDAEEQPESGYPDGRLNTKPSADRREKDDAGEDVRRTRTGSEAEFDSQKPRP